jgi:hypothetical protein
MTDLMAATNEEIAMTLLDQHGSSAWAYVEDKVKAAWRDDDWEGVKTWRAVGQEVEKLRTRPLSRPLAHHR